MGQNLWFRKAPLPAERRWDWRKLGEAAVAGEPVEGPQGIEQRREGRSYPGPGRRMTKKAWLFA